MENYEPKIDNIQRCINSCSINLQKDVIKNDLNVKQKDALKTFQNNLEKINDQLKMIFQEFKNKIT